MSAYATVDQVCALFPRFARNQTGNISDAQIQTWINSAAGVIHSAFLRRNINADNLTNPVVDDPTYVTPIYHQADILEGINEAYACFKLGQAIWATLGPAEQAFVRGQFNYWETALKRLDAGEYDKEFLAQSRTESTLPGLAGVAGAEADPTESAYGPPDGLKRPFWMNQVF